MHKIQASQSFFCNIIPKLLTGQLKIKIFVPVWLHWTCNNLSEAGARGYEFTSRYVFYMQQYVVIKTKLHISHISVIVYNLPVETILLSAYSINIIVFFCTRCSVWACSKTVTWILWFFFPKKSFEYFLVLLACKETDGSTTLPGSLRTDPLLGGSTQGNTRLYKADSRKQRQAKPFSGNLPETEGRSPRSSFCRFCCTTNSLVSLPAITPN